MPSFGCLELLIDTVKHSHGNHYPQAQLIKSFQNEFFNCIQIASSTWSMNARFLSSDLLEAIILVTT